MAHGLWQSIPRESEARSDITVFTGIGSSSAAKQVGEFDGYYRIGEGHRQIDVLDG